MYSKEENVMVMFNDDGQGKPYSQGSRCEGCFGCFDKGIRKRHLRAPE